jgi:hypothetical protein
MFSVYCPGHRSEILLGRRSIDALRNTGDGIELHWTCRCGTRGVELTGRRRAPATDGSATPYQRVA